MQEAQVSVATIMTTGRKMGDGTRDSKVTSKRRSFWNGVLEGFSGPALMASRPRFLSEVVEIEGNQVRLKLPSGRCASIVASSHEEAMTVARAITDATKIVMDKNGLVLGQEATMRLDHEGKLRQVRRLQVKRRTKDGPK